MVEIKCVLCHGQASTLESIDTSKLIHLYRSRTGIPVEKYFNSQVVELLTCSNCELKFYWPQSVGDGQFYDQLQRLSNYYLEDKAEFHEAAKFVDQDDDVLEIGCGEGLFARLIKCRSFTGLEFSDDAIQKARKRDLTIIKESILEHARQNKGRYSVVCFFQVLEHIEDPDSFLKASIDCLSFGGKLILAVPSEDSFIRSASNFYLNMPPHHASRWTDVALRNLARQYNLHLEYLFHEPLQKVHRKFYVSTMAFRWLNKLFSRRTTTIDDTLAGTILYGIAVIFAILASPFLFNAHKIRGQSVMVVYSKN